MSRRIKQLRTLMRARRRLRDVAAGAFARAEAETIAAAVEERTVTEARRALIDEAPARILGGSDARLLLVIEMERGVADRLTAEAAERRAGAARLSEGRRAELGRREGELRTADKLLERQLAADGAAARREEQRAADDMVSARARRSWGST